MWESKEEKKVKVYFVLFQDWLVRDVGESKGGTKERVYFFTFPD
jgi:hypothetical protein